ncbi:MAG: SpoIIE family protein phosphatase [Clostridia bacterium]|nr:SpoIIE family protein phosphatase [Clostridia bacterium]
MNLPEINNRLTVDNLRAPNWRDALICGMLFLASRAQVLGMFPFGPAFFAACFDKSIAYLGVASMALALITGGASMVIVKYLTSALVFWIYSRVVKKNSVVLDSVAAGGSLLLGGLMFMLYRFDGIFDLLLLVVESVIAGMMYIIFKKAEGFMASRKTRMRAAQDEIISIAVSAGVLITGLGGIAIPPGIGIADVLSVYAVLCIAYHTSLTAAGSGGLSIGFLASMSYPSAVVTMGIFGISALFANLLKGFGRFGVALGFLAGGSIALLYAGNTFDLPVSILEISLGASFFALTPKKIHDMIGTLFTRSIKLESLDADVRVREYLTMRLEKTAEAFKSLEECFAAVSQKRLKAYNKEVGALFDETADRVCDGCPNAVKCWQKDFARTYKNIMLLLSTIEEKGILTLDNVPPAFRERCIRTELFVVEFNHVYELYKKQLVRVGEAAVSRDLVARQYREVAALMDEMAGRITEGFEFKESAENEIANELVKYDITAFEISVVEGANGRVEVYLRVNKPSERQKIISVLEEVLETPMEYDEEGSDAAMRFVSRAKYSVDIAIRQTRRDFSDVSGDGADSFMSEDYKYYIVIADGMGSGKLAMSESHMTLRLLREFLMSGFAVKTALDMINSALCLKLDYESFSTIDLLSIDLMTGICEFYKIGSAESVILHGANVETIFSVSLPVGISEGIHAESQTKKLGDGDTILMMTDGVSEAGFGTARTDWIKKEIQKPFDVMDEMAEAVMETAVKKSRGTIADDMTVAAVRLVEN